MTLSILFLKKSQENFIYVVLFQKNKSRCGVFDATFAQRQNERKCRIGKMLVAPFCISTKPVKIGGGACFVSAKLRYRRASTNFFWEIVSHAFDRRQTLFICTFPLCVTLSDTLAQKVSPAFLFRRISRRAAGKSSHSTCSDLA